MTELDTVGDGIPSEPWTIMNHVFECFVTSISEHGMDPDKFCFLGPTVGVEVDATLITWGKPIGWVRYGGETVTSLYPNGNSCVSESTYTWELGIQRCYKIPPRNAMVTLKDSILMSKEQMLDRAAMLTVARCCLKDLVEDVAGVEYTPLPAQGGIFGGVLTFTTGPLV